MYRSTQQSIGDDATLSTVITRVKIALILYLTLIIINSMVNFLQFIRGFDHVIAYISQNKAA